jgi:hypothetical protein
MHYRVRIMSPIQSLLAGVTMRLRKKGETAVVGESPPIRVSEAGVNFVRPSELIRSGRAQKQMRAAERAVQALRQASTESRRVVTTGG